MASVATDSFRDTSGLCLTSEDGKEVFMEHRITQKSEYLKTVLDCRVEKSDQPLVVVSSDILSAWLAFVQQPEHQHAEWMPMESLEAILKAADILIDEATTDEVAHLIADRLFAPAATIVPGLALQKSHQSAVSLDSLESAPPSPATNAHKPLSRGRKIGAKMRGLFSKVMRTSTPRLHAVPAEPSTPSTCSRSDRTDTEPDEGSSASEVLGRVSEDLALSILHAAPNVYTLLATLPPKLHPLALRAHNPSIDSHHSLIFHFRDITAAVPAVRAAASVSHLTSLALHAVRTPNCPLAPQAPADAAAVFRVVADMPRLSSFTLKGWVLDIDGELKLLQHLRQPSFGGGRLRHLGLSHLRASMTVVAPALAPFAATLTCLDLSNTHLSDMAAQTLALYVGDLRALERLLLGSTHIADVGWEALLPQVCRLTALETLDVSSVHVSTHKFFHAAPDSSASGSVHSTGETSGGIAAEDPGASEPIDAVWTWVRVLDVSHNRQLRHLPDLGERLACMTRMQRLNCAGMGLFGEPAVDALRAMHKLPLQCVDWSYNDISAGAAQLSACLERGWRGLTSLTLCRAEIRCGAAETLAGSLACLQQLQELHMPRNGLAVRGGVALAPAIGALRTLRVLNLAQNELGDIGAHAIAQHAAGLVHLEVVDLSGNGVRGLGAAAAADAAAALPQLQVMALQGNEIGDEGAPALAAALARCSRGGTGSVGAHGVMPCIFRLRDNRFGPEAQFTLRAAALDGTSLSLDDP
eukprot:jgi/Ulvmu1/9851/UM057_0004.1